MARELRVPVSALSIGENFLPREASRYVSKVHRKREGEELVLFDPEAGIRGRGTILRSHPDEVVVRVDAIETPPSKTMPVWLFQSMGKGDKPDQALRDVTVLGAEKLVLVLSERTVAKGAGEERNDRLRRIAVESARQAGRESIPRIEGPLEFDRALELVPEGLKIALGWHESSTPLAELCANWDERDGIVSLFVGPEGGFDESEVGLLRERGFGIASLGPLVLRTEVAATVALAAFRLEHSRRAGL